MKPRPNTPGVLGYLLAYGLAAGFFGLVFGAFDGGMEGEYEISWLGIGFFVAVFAAVVGFPAGALLMFLVHRSCRSIPEQSAHVAAAGAAGLVGALGGLVMFHGGDDHVLNIGIVLLGGVSTALARTAVIPIVNLRRVASLRPMIGS